MRAELEKSLGLLENPLDFASKKNFSTLERMPGLAESVRSLSTKVLTSDPPDEIRKLVAELRDSFSDFEKQGPQEKRKRVSSALAAVREALAIAGAGGRGDVPRKAPASKRGPSPAEKSSSRSPLSSESVMYLKGAGPKIAEFLERRSIRTVHDLLFHSPRKYDDRRKIASLSEVAPGDSCTVRGRVVSAGEITKGRRNFFQAVLFDGTRRLALTWFNYKSSYLRGLFRKDRSFIVHGKVSVPPRGGTLQMIHPLPQDVEIIEDEEDTGNPLQFGRIVPVYPLTEGITQKKLRELVRNALDAHAREFEGLMPEDIREELDLMDLPQALEQVHFPPDDSSPVDFEDAGSVAASRAHRTVIFFEFFVLQLGLFSRKQKMGESRGISFGSAGSLKEKLLRSLPFSLTEAQGRAVSEIDADMASPRPMNRLLQGDVGSGKTLVALVSMLRAVESGYQAALMVPTEVLAEQHFRNIRRMTRSLGVSTALLKSALSRADKSRVYEEMRTGRADIVVGTHALISEAVDFRALGLAVIDEQHRFGVVQRARLARKAETPDQLVMTATPIPRTLAITVYGDLDLSVIDELPPSRKKAQTFVLADTPKNRTWLYDQVRERLGQGRQAYFVYPFIEESENEDFRSVRHATRMVGELAEEFSGFRALLLHGRMKSDERDAAIAEFLAGRCDILVSTTVIEVGVDVPNATAIVIENAERFGLSQLHQMRGRVGRGEHASACYILYSAKAGAESEERLRIMGETSDGFRISEFDLAARGPGEFIGTKQSGVPGFSFANLIRDSALLNESRDRARGLTERPEDCAEYEKISAYVAGKWGEMLNLGAGS